MASSTDCCSQAQSTIKLARCLRSYRGARLQHAKTEFYQLLLKALAGQKVVLATDEGSKARYYDDWLTEIGYYEMPTGFEFVLVCIHEQNLSISPIAACDAELGHGMLITPLDKADVSDHFENVVAEWLRK